jgi:alkylation response protein AidB-like acyl-CoA dehydrogenase
MGVTIAAEADPRRISVREWLKDNPNPTGRALAEAGYVVPHWPRPYGLDADPVLQVIIDEELERVGVRRPFNPIGIGWAGPTLLLAGSDEQKRRHLFPTLAGEELWCQLFSEPDAGSDLASLTTRAVRDGDCFVVNGSKTWTSLGHKAAYGILIARTDPTTSLHKGISYFICPMDLPGISVQPIADMTGAHAFNQVFFNDVRLPIDCLVGDEGEGWRLAAATLANERVALSSDGSLWGSGPSHVDLVRLANNLAGINPVLRDRVADVYARGEVLRIMRLRTFSARLAGRSPGPEASIQKIFADELGQALMSVAQQLVGAEALLTGSGPPGLLEGRAVTGPTENVIDRSQFPDVDPVWHYGMLFAPALTIGGGTWAIQRNVVAERVLGLPREPRGELP